MVCVMPGFGCKIVDKHANKFINKFITYITFLCLNLSATSPNLESSPRDGQRTEVEKKRTAHHFVVKLLVPLPIKFHAPREI